MSAEKVTTHGLRPMTEVQIEQTREFIAGLQQGSQPYWDMVNVGDALWRELEITPELVVLYADGVEDFNPWYEGWRMNTWRIKGEFPFRPGYCSADDDVALRSISSVRPREAFPNRVNSTFHDLNCWSRSRSAQPCASPRRRLKSS